MAYGSVHCPQCGLKFNIRQESINTMRRCQGCGYQFVITAPPAKGGASGCLSAVGGLLVVSVVVAFGCCGLLGYLGSQGESSRPPTDPIASSTTVAPPSNAATPFSTKEARPISKDPPKPDPPRYASAGNTDAELDVRRLGREIVENHLKFPLDASFGWGSEVHRADNGIWVTKGTVKAPNAFGANLTHAYTVAMTCTDPAAKTWKTLLVNIGGEVVYVDLPEESTPDSSSSSQVDMEAVEREVEKANKLADASAAAERSRHDRTRTWSTTDGKFSVEAEFVYIIRDSVKLRKLDGKEVTVPLSKLSQSDLDWIESRQQQK